MRNSNGLYVIIGALLVIVIGGAIWFYQEQNKTGIDIQVGGEGISVEAE